MIREPGAASQRCQVRVVSKVLTNNNSLCSSLDCVNSRMKVSRGFAQSPLIIIVNYDVVSGL